MIGDKDRLKADELKRLMGDWPEAPEGFARQYESFVTAEWLPPSMNTYETIGRWFWDIAVGRNFGRGVDLITLLDIRAMLISAIEKLEWIIGYRYGAKYMKMTSQQYRDVQYKLDRDKRMF